MELEAECQSPTSPNWRERCPGYDEAFRALHTIKKRQQMTQKYFEAPQKKREKLSLKRKADEPAPGDSTIQKKIRKPSKKLGRNYPVHKRLESFWSEAEQKFLKDFDQYFKPGFDYHEAATLRAERNKRIAAERKKSSEKDKAESISASDDSIEEEEEDSE